MTGAIIILTAFVTAILSGIFGMAGGLMLIAAMIMIINLIVDVLYGFINPRIRH